MWWGWWRVGFAPRKHRDDDDLVRTFQALALAPVLALALALVSSAAPHRDTG